MREKEFEQTRTSDYLRERAARGDRAKFEAVMAKVPDVPPMEGDELPESYKTKYGIGAQQHVVPYKGKWAVRKAKANNPSHVFPTQQEAVKMAREISQLLRSDVVIHGKDGRIQRREKVGNGSRSR